MNCIDKLRELMTIDVSMNTADIETRFEQIAQLLLGHFALQKGDTKYLFREIEFYFYNKNHRDIITHPRVSKALFWYVNDYGGIDLNFASNIESDFKSDIRGKKILDDSSCFGGILIRQLISEDGHSILRGPWACAELFRSYEATGFGNELPVLVEHCTRMVGYMCKPRINLLSSNQTVHGKVDYILEDYQEHPNKSDLYKCFDAFITKRYRYVRCDMLLHDENTNVVYFSPWLRDEKEGHPAFYKRLINLLKGIGIETRELNHTNDYWARDYMPIQLTENEFLKYRYYPDYLVKSKDKDAIKTITDVTKVLRGMGINCRSTKLVIDGGNMVACGPYIVMTDKVFAENQRDIGDQEFKALLESELGHPVIITPWRMHGDFNSEDTDKYGHADGFIKWCGGNRVLMGNHGDEYPAEAAEIRRILEEYGFDVTEMSFKDKVSSLCPELNWAYINFLQIGKNIIIPAFNIDEDSIAQQYVQEAFPDCSIYQIEMAEIATEGGALHCISWNVCLPDR